MLKMINLIIFYLTIFDKFVCKELHRDRVPSDRKLPEQLNIRERVRGHEVRNDRSL